MKKKVILVFLCVIGILVTGKLASHKKQVSSLLLYNVEALANSSEHADRGYCFGTGSVDCPVSHHKVEYVFSGYSIEE